MRGELTRRQRDFIREFLVDLNGTEAAIRSGSRPDEARAAASAYLRTQAVADAIGTVLVRRLTDTVKLSRLLKDLVTGPAPFMQGVRRIGKVLAGRAGFAVTRILPPEPGSDELRLAKIEGTTDILYAYYKGRCFYCRGDSPITRRVLRGHDWDPHFKKILHTCCAKKGTGMVVEVGANIGATFVPECATLPNFKFVLFEPVPMFFELLQKNVASFEATNVVLHNAAVSDGRSSEIVLIHDTLSGGVAAGSIFHDQRIAVVPSVSLDEMFAGQTITLMKVDVDGYEMDVFRGGRDLITRSKPDILFEYNPLTMEVRGIPPLDIPKFLMDLGIGTFDLYTEGGRFLETTASPSRIYKVFRARKSPLTYLDVHAYADR